MKRINPLRRLGTVIGLPKPMGSRFVVVFSLLFVIIFCIGLATTMAGIPFSQYQGWISREKDRTFRTLNKMADMEQERLQLELSKLRADIRILANHPEIQDLIELHADPEAVIPTKKRRSTMKNLHQFFNYANAIRIVDLLNGTILFSTDPNEVGQNGAGQPAFVGVQKGRNDYISDAFYQDNGLMVQASYIAKDQHRSVHAVVVMDVPIERIVNTFTVSGRGPWPSMSSMLVNARGHPLNPLEAANDETSPNTLPLVLAGSNGDGLIESHLASGEPVLAAYRHFRLFPEWNWIIIVHVQRHEAFETVAWVIHYAIIYGLLTTLLFAAVAFYLARQMTSPLSHLTSVAIRMMQGDHTIRSQISRQDEVGVLATAFDAMLDVVQDTLSAMEQRVHDRTRDLSQELSARMAIAQQLRESEQRFRQAILEAPFPAILHADNGAVLLLNRAWSTITGFTSHELNTTAAIGSKMIPPDQHAEYQLNLTRAYSSQNHLAHRTINILTSYGESRIWEFHSAPLGTLPDSRRLVICMAKDITEQQQAIHALEASGKLLTEAQRIANMGDWSWELESNQMRWSEASSQILGAIATPTTTLATFLDLVHPEDRVRITQCLSAAVANKSPLNSDHRIVTPGGLIRFFHTLGQVKCAADGTPYQMIGTMHDITERHLALLRQQELERQLLQTQKMEAIGVLAGGIAHDFNNILGGIIGYVELSLMDLPEHSEIYGHLQEVFKASLRARDLVSQLLAFSHRTNMERRRLNLIPLLKETLKFIRASLPSHIEIRTTILAREALCLADSTQLHQVILNLCTNAAYAMHDSNGVLEALIEIVELVSHQASPHGLPPGRYLHFYIKDSGEGIPPELIHRIFDPFFTTKPVGEGSGLGLSVAHGIITSHQGTIFVESQPGKGSTFHCYLPESPGESQPEIQHLRSEPGSTGKGHILLVDDEPALLEAMRHMIQSLGYQVTVAASSPEALELFQADPTDFDLLFTDQTMPNFSGKELGLRCQASHPQLPVILCTGYATTEDVSMGHPSAFAALLHKPITMGELSKAIEQALAKRPK